MAWRVELSDSAYRELNRLDMRHRLRILKILGGRLAKLDNPRAIGQSLYGSRLGEFWKYRLGEFRLIVSIEDARLVILALRIGHRKDVYR